MSSDLLPKNEDVTLSSAFIADVQKRTDVLVLYAFLETLREIPVRVTEPLMGEIRMRWWYEAFEEIRDGRTPRYHPLTESIQRLISHYGLPVQDFLDMVEGQMPLLDAGPLDVKTALAVVDTGEGRLATLAAFIIDKQQDASALSDTARFYGLAQLKRSGRLVDAGGTEGAHLKRQAARAAKGLPPGLMPLGLPAALAEDIWSGKTAGPLSKRLKLFLAFITGRI